MSEPDKPKDETAAYIARMLAGLVEIAEDRRFGMLSYLLAIAREEAEARARDSEAE